VTQTIASDEEVLRELWCGKGVVKQTWPTFKVLSQHLPRGTENNHENLSQESWSPGRDFNLHKQENIYRVYESSDYNKMLT
jgi:hypothetical protein